MTDQAAEMPLIDVQHEGLAGLDWAALRRSQLSAFFRLCWQAVCNAILNETSAAMRPSEEHIPNWWEGPWYWYSVQGALQHLLMLSAGLPNGGALILGCARLGIACWELQKLPSKNWNVESFRQHALSAAVYVGADQRLLEEEFYSAIIGTPKAG